MELRAAEARDSRSRESEVAQIGEHGGVTKSPWFQKYSTSLDMPFIAVSHARQMDENATVHRA